MAETVIITGHGLDVDHQAEGANPKRRRPPEYVPPPPTDGPDLLVTIRWAGVLNPYWEDEANWDADENPDGLSPLKLARKWVGYRIEPQEAA